MDKNCLSWLGLLKIRLRNQAMTLPLVKENFISTQPSQIQQQFFAGVSCVLNFLKLLWMLTESIFLVMCSLEISLVESSKTS